MTSVLIEKGIILSFIFKCFLFQQLSIKKTFKLKKAIVFN